MAEPTLTLDWIELQARCGSYMGWGRGAVRFNDEAWDSTRQYELDGMVASGLRKFYYPQPMEGMSNSYDWSFLKPVGNFILASGATTVPLPEDYGGKEGPVTVLTTFTNSRPWWIEERNEGQIRQMLSQFPSNSGPPQFVTQVCEKGTGPTGGQRFHLLFFPTADQAYTLQLNYYVNPDYLTRATPYAYGGSQHSETILEACLSVAESRMDDSKAVHAMEFEKRLMASISMDRKNKPQTLGINRDRSDDLGYRDNAHYWAPASTYNGQSFG